MRLLQFRSNRVPYVKIVRLAVRLKSGNLYKFNTTDPSYTYLIVGAKNKKEAVEFAVRRMVTKKFLVENYVEDFQNKTYKEMTDLIRRRTSLLIGD
jgi:hypothetical protein